MQPTIKYERYPPGSACPCCNKNGLQEITAQSYYALCLKLEYVPAINSGWRCAKHNSEIPGSAKASYHMKGLALDLNCPIGEQNMLIAEARNCGFRGIGRGANFVHLDSRSIPAEWRYDNNGLVTKLA